MLLSAAVALPAEAETRGVVGRLSAVAVDSAHITLTWNPVAGARSYEVDRGSSLLLADTRLTTFTDSLLWPRSRYSYTVRAISSSGHVLASAHAVARTKRLPATGFPLPYPASSVWSKPIGNAAAVPNSPALIAYLVAHASSPNMTLRSYGVSIAEAQPGAPRVRVSCGGGGGCLRGTLPMPLTAVPDPQEGHLAVYEPGAGREWDMFEAARSSSGWHAYAATSVTMRRGNPIIPAGRIGGNAANLPLIAGVVRPEEILQGHIDHALVFAIPSVSRLGHVCPATHNDGSSTDPNALREGMRLQLDPTLDVGSLAVPAWEKTLARAMQTYGMYLTDEGGSLSIFAEDPASRGYDAWKLVGMPEGDAVSIVGIPWDRFRVVSAPC